jgi:hypothetical protein
MPLLKPALVCFCDASGKAYAATIYVLHIGETERKIDLIFSKTRLAPVSIPRLELMAVLIGVRCLNFVRGQLQTPIHETHLFTDSQCTLQWISSTKQLSVFVRNRVLEIKTHTDVQLIFSQIVTRLIFQVEVVQLKNYSNMNFGGTDLNGYLKLFLIGR